MAHNPTESIPLEPKRAQQSEPAIASVAEIDLDQPDWYINRELSLLEFNWRVLEQAKDEQLPLLERLNFLCISSSNMDEFFEVRVAGVIQKAELGSTLTGPDNLTPQETLAAISRRAHEIVSEQYRVLNAILLPLLEQENIRFIRRAHWTKAQQEWLAKYFEEELLPVLSPLGLDSAHPFPRILNKSLNFIISLTGKDAFGRNSGRAILQAPRALPRIIRLPAGETGGGPHDFVFLTSVIHAFINELFHGMKVTGCHQFRVTRNSDLFVDEEEIDDLMSAVEGELAMRNYGDEVRLEIADNCPEETVDFLLARFGMTRERLYLVDGPVNLNRLQEIYGMIDRPDLKFKPLTPRLPAVLRRSGDMFEAMQKEDILLLHPYDSFSPVMDFLHQAAADPDVLAIKMTLYRTRSDSAIVKALLDAARAGKEVTVVIELRARFDEEANIALATHLQEAAVHVVYGVVGYKTHAKMMLVLRREGRGLHNYVHLGTGNYHPSTARLYTDYSLFSCDKELAEDVRRVFMQLTSLGKVEKLNKLLQSPFSLHKSLLEKVDREIKHVREGRTARIIIKVNSVVEPELIKALYRASMAGVEVKLIVRGICCLKPGIKGISENIEVRSVVGRFLEHSRVYAFENGGNPEVYASSADLMDRNMFRRVEACFPIEKPKLQERVMEDLGFYLKDNSQAWLLQSDGAFRHLTPGDAPCFQVQTKLLEAYEI